MNLSLYMLGWNIKFFDELGNKFFKYSLNLYDYFFIKYLYFMVYLCLVLI